MKSLAISLICLFGFVSYHNSPQLINWATLADVSFEEKYYEDLELYLPYPTFGSQVKALAGKEVQIEGYIIPIEPERYILSQNPFASCFFTVNTESITFSGKSL